MESGTKSEARGVRSAAKGPTRVLHLVVDLEYGGLQRLIQDLVRRLDPAHFESHVLPLVTVGPLAARLDGYARLHLPRRSSHRSSRLASRLSMLWPRALVRQIRGIAPDVVHIHSGVWYKASLAARGAGVPRVIYTEHGRKGAASRTERLLDGLASRRTDVVVAVSEAVAQQLATEIGCEPAKLRVVLNGVDSAAFAPRADSGRLRAELGIAPGVPILGSIGRLEPIKGYDLMVEALAALRELWPAGEELPALVLAGDGMVRDLLARRIRQDDLARKVHLLGWRDDIHDLLSAFTLFTMSSRSEGTSLSLLEAMSMGICPVVTEVGGNAAVLGPHLRHRLVAPEDPLALARAWREALADPERREADARAARQRVREAFDVELMVRHYERLYRGPA